MEVLRLLSKYGFKANNLEQGGPAGKSRSHTDDKFRRSKTTRDDSRYEEMRDRAIRDLVKSLLPAEREYRLKKQRMLKKRMKSSSSESVPGLIPASKPDELHIEDQQSVSPAPDRTEKTPTEMDAKVPIPKPLAKSLSSPDTSQRSVLTVHESDSKLIVSDDEKSDFEIKTRAKKSDSRAPGMLLRSSVSNHSISDLSSTSLGSHEKHKKAADESAKTTRQVQFADIAFGAGVTVRQPVTSSLTAKLTASTHSNRSCSTGSSNEDPSGVYFTHTSTMRDTIHSTSSSIFESADMEDEDTMTATLSESVETDLLVKPSLSRRLPSAPLKSVKGAKKATLLRMTPKMPHSLSSRRLLELSPNAEKQGRNSKVRDEVLLSDSDEDSSLMLPAEPPRRPALVSRDSFKIVSPGSDEKSEEVEHSEHSENEKPTLVRQLTASEDLSTQSRSRSKSNASLQSVKEYETFGAVPASPCSSAVSRFGSSMDDEFSATVSASSMESGMVGTTRLHSFSQPQLRQPIKRRTSTPLLSTQNGASSSDSTANGIPDTPQLDSIPSQDTIEGTSMMTSTSDVDSSNDFSLYGTSVSSDLAHVHPNPEQSRNFLAEIQSAMSKSPIATPAATSTLMLSGLSLSAKTYPEKVRTPLRRSENSTSPVIDAPETRTVLTESSTAGESTSSLRGGLVTSPFHSTVGPLTIANTDCETPSFRGFVKSRSISRTGLEEETDHFTMPSTIPFALSPPDHTIPKRRVSQRRREMLQVLNSISPHSEVTLSPTEISRPLGPSAVSGKVRERVLAVEDESSVLSTSSPSGLSGSALLLTPTEITLAGKEDSVVAMPDFICHAKPDLKQPTLTMESCSAGSIDEEIEQRPNKFPLTSSTESESAKKLSADTESRESSPAAIIQRVHSRHDSFIMGDSALLNEDTSDVLCTTVSSSWSRRPRQLSRRQMARDRRKAEAAGDVHAGLMGTGDTPILTLDSVPSSKAVEPSLKSDVSAVSSDGMVILDYNPEGEPDHLLEETEHSSDYLFLRRDGLRGAADSLSNTSLRSEQSVIAPVHSIQKRKVDTPFPMSSSADPSFHIDSPPPQKGLGLKKPSSMARGFGVFDSGVDSSCDPSDREESKEACDLKKEQKQAMVEGASKARSTGRHKISPSLSKKLESDDGEQGQIITPKERMLRITIDKPKVTEEVRTPEETIEMAKRWGDDGYDQDGGEEFLPNFVDSSTPDFFYSNHPGGGHGDSSDMLVPCSEDSILLAGEHGDITPAELLVRCSSAQFWDSDKEEFQQLLRADTLGEAPGALDLDGEGSLDAGGLALDIGDDGDHQAMTGIELDVGSSKASNKIGRKVPPGLTLIGGDVVGPSPDHRFDLDLKDRLLLNPRDGSSFDDVTPNSADENASLWDTNGPMKRVHTERTQSMLNKKFPEEEFVDFEDVRVGQGAGGVVRKRFHFPTCQVVAVKSGFSTLDSTLLEQTKKEVEFLKLFAQCPQIVEMVCYGKNQSTNNVDIALEYMQGGSLKDFIREADEHAVLANQEQVSKHEERCQRIAYSILKSLQALEIYKVVHNDIKPGNILYRKRGAVKLCDFGVAEEMKMSDSRVHRSTLSDCDSADEHDDDDDDLIDGENHDDHEDEAGHPTEVSRTVTAESVIVNRKGSGYDSSHFRPKSVESSVSYPIEETTTSMASSTTLQTTHARSSSRILFPPVPVPLLKKTSSEDTRKRAKKQKKKKSGTKLFGKLLKKGAKKLTKLGRRKSSSSKHSKHKSSESVLSSAADDSRATSKYESSVDFSGDVLFHAASMPDIALDHARGLSAASLLSERSMTNFGLHSMMTATATATASSGVSIDFESCGYPDCPDRSTCQCECRTPEWRAKSSAHICRCRVEKRKRDGPYLSKIRGTTKYFAPEKCMCEVIAFDTKSDIWSLGLTMFEVLNAREIEEVRPTMICESPPKLDDDRFSKAARDFIDQCLTLDPCKRPSAAELLSHEWIVSRKRGNLGFSGEHEYLVNDLVFIIKSLINYYLRQSPPDSTPSSAASVAAMITPTSSPQGEDESLDETTKAGARKSGDSSTSATLSASARLLISADSATKLTQSAYGITDNDCYQNISKHTGFHWRHVRELINNTAQKELNHQFLTHV